MLPVRTIKLCAWIGLFGLMVILFLPATANDFVNWDDLSFVVNNPAVAALSGRSILWAFTTFYQGIWHPLTWLSHAADRSLGGLSPGYHHLVSVLIHGINVVLFCTLLLKLLETRGVQERSRYVAAFAAAVLYGVHPLRVEPVAWVSARKDLLCAFFFLGSLIAYIGYAQCSRPKGRRVRYLGSLALAAAALMSKPSAMSLPVVMLTLDFYPLRRLDWESIGRRVWEKVPFFAMAIGTALLNMKAVGSSAVPFSYVPLQTRVMNAFHSLFFYLHQTIFPHDLLPLYQLDRGLDYFGPKYIACAILFLLLTFLAIRRSLKGDRIWASCWFAYLALLAPVLGLFMSYRQAAADRYTYLPTMVVWMVIGAGIARLWQWAEHRGRGPKLAMILSFLAVAVFFGRSTLAQIDVWRNTESMWRYVVEHADYVPGLAYAALGQELEKKDRLDEALAYFKVAYSSNPENSVYLESIGVVLAKLGRKSEAMQVLSKIGAKWPQDASAMLHQARILLSLARPDEAIKVLKKAERLSHQRERATVLRLLSVAYLMRGDKSRAEEYYSKYLRASSAARLPKQTRSRP